MKNVLKIAAMTSYLISFYHGNVSAAEDSIMKQQQEISSRVSRMLEQNWQTYTDAQEKPRKQKFLRQEERKKYGKQEAKGKALKAEDNSRLKDILGWYASNNRVNVKYTEAKQIGKYGDGALYVYMDPSFMNPQWKDAFDKGFATHAMGHNGIKIINNSVIEIKINADARLYAQRLHKNDRGDYIAILDKEGRHREISRKVNKRMFEVRDCISMPQQKNRQ